MIKYGKLSPDEWQKYKKIRLEALKNQPMAFLSSYEDGLNDPEEKWRKNLEGGKMIFAFDGDEVVGLAGWYGETREKTKHIANIVSVYVNENYRGQKIGQKLTEMVIDEIKKSSTFEKIKLGVIDSQKAAIGLYEKLGFTKAGLLKRELKIDGQYYDEVEMEMML